MVELNKIGVVSGDQLPIGEQLPKENVLEGVPTLQCLFAVKVVKLTYKLG
jgi:hypothetical protein